MARISLLIIFLFVCSSVVIAAPLSFQFGGKTYEMTEDEMNYMKNPENAQKRFDAKTRERAKQNKEEQREIIQMNTNDDYVKVEDSVIKEKIANGELSPLAEDEEYVYLDKNCIKKDKGFWKNEPGRGWFWGQVQCEPVKRKKKQKVDLPKEEEVAKEESTEDSEEYAVSALTGERYKKLPKVAKVPFDVLNELDPREISEKIEPETRRIVVMYPTDENILEYRKLKNWIMAKAMMLARHDIQVRTNNPNETMPNLNSQRVDMVLNNSITVAQYNGKMKLIDKYSREGRMLIVVYTQQGCKFCTRYMDVLRSVQEDIPRIQIITRDIMREGSAEAREFKVQQTPDTFMYFKKKNGEYVMQRVATGLVSRDRLEDAIVRALAYVGEDIDDFYFNY